MIQLGIEMPRPELDQRIADRVRRMWHRGLVDEVRQPRDSGSARRQDGQPRARLRPGAEVPGRRLDRDEAAAQTIHGHPPLRPPPGSLVPPRSARSLDPSWRAGSAALRRCAALGPSGRRHDRSCCSAQGPTAARAARRPNRTSIGVMRFAKGQGTGNDFVILPDPDGEMDLSPALVARLCDRHFGIGADGVLRVVRTAVAGPGCCWAGG